MRWPWLTLLLGFSGGLAACALQQPDPKQPTEISPVPDVPPSAPAAPPSTPAPTVAPKAPSAEAASGVMIHSAANPTYCIDAAQDGSAKRVPERRFTCHGQENQ